MFSFLTCSPVVVFQAYVFAASQVTRPAAHTRVQTGVVDLYGALMRNIAKMCAKHPSSEEKLNEYLNMAINVFESLILTVQDMANATTGVGIVCACMRFLKMITRDNILALASKIKDAAWITNLLEEVTASLGGNSSVVQSLGAYDFEWCTKSARWLLDNYKMIRNSPTIGKLHSLLKYFLTFGLFSCFGLDFSSFGFKDFEIRRTKQEYGSRESFFFTIFEDVVWFMERGAQAVHLKSFQPFLHSSKAYGEFVDEAEKVLEDQVKMNCPQAFPDFDEHKFQGRLDKVLETAKYIEKFVEENSHEKTVIRKLARELRMVSAKFQSKDYAQLDRKPPFSVLVLGDSGIAKTQFTNILFHHFGKVHGKDTDPKNMWTRNAVDKFYSGYRTSKWCIRLDDVAQFSTTLNTLDPTIADLIMLSNGVAFTAPMPDLEDKGVVAVRPDLLIGTTNVIELNASSYFSCPLAVRRRFPYIISLEVKKEFHKPGSTMVDEAAIPPVKPGEYMDIWNIRVRKVIAQEAGEKMSTARLVDVYGDQEGLEKPKVYTCIDDFLEWYANMSLTFTKHQDKGSLATETMHAIELCKVCYRAESKCRCGVVQTNEVDSLFDSDISTDDEMTTADLIDIRNILHRTPRQNDQFVNLWDTGVPMHTFATDDLTESEEDEIVVEEVISNIDLTTKTFSERCHDMVDTTYAELMTVAIMIARKSKTILETVDDVRIALVNAGYNYVASQYSIILDMVILHQLDKFRKRFVDFGNAIYEKLCDMRIVYLCMILVGAWAIWQAVSYLMPKSDSLPQAEKPVLQGGVASELPKDDKVNPWLKDEIQLSEYFVPAKSDGWRKMPRPEILRRIKQNVVALRSEFTREGRIKNVPATAMCVWGHVYVTNNHSLPTDVDELKVYMTDMPENGNVNTNIVFALQQSMIMRIPEKDLAFFRCRVTPPRADLRELFLKHRFAGMVASGAYINCRWQSSPSIMDVRCIRFEEPEVGSVRLPGWFGRLDTFDPKEMTLMGDCGSPLVAFPPTGPLIVGIHRTLTGNEVGAPEILREHIDAAVQFFGSQVSCGTPSFVSEKLGPLNHKSVIHWENEGQARVYGSAAQGSFRCAPKSRVGPTIICDEAQKEGFIADCGPPCMKGPEVWHKNIAPTLTQSFCVDADKLKRCVDAFTADVLAEIDPKALAECFVLDDKTTMNGMAGVRFLDKVKRNTSMGYPYRKSKLNFLNPLEPTTDYPDAVEYTEEVMEEVNLIRDVYSRGERYMPVFIMSLKDEPIPNAKIAIKKTRGFMGGSAAWQFVCRQHLMGFIRLFQLNSFTFEGAPGMNCNSRQWKKLYNHLTAFGKKQIVAGDFGMFDKRMSPEFIQAAFDFIVNIVRAAGYSEEEIQNIRCMAVDTAFPVCWAQGDVIEFFGSNPSGNILTVILNCIVNSLYMRYVWATISPMPLSEFKKFVHLMTYGDDNIMGVSLDCPWFNHTALAKVLASIGVVYTMAEKEAESVPYIDISDASFLKRKFVPVDDDRVACPLDWKSIDKMLTSCVASRSVCPEEQAVQSIRSAVGEFFQYGPDVFNSNVAKMKRIVRNCHLEPFVQKTTFPSWQELLDAHHASI